MHQAFEGPGIGREGLSREAEDLVEALGPGQALADGVVFPIAEPDKALGIFEPCQVEVYQKSKTVWIAVGTYMGYVCGVLMQLVSP